MTASTWVRTPELDTFGPWILRVRSSQDVPALFRPVVDLAGARVAVKIPRPIERRDARAGMDLYDTLVLVREDGVEVWSRAPKAPDGRTRRWLAADDLVALEDSTDLLDGMLRLHTAHGAPVEVPYNGSSADVVLTLLDEIRFFWRRPGAFPDRQPEMALDTLGPDDVSLVNHHRDLHRHDPLLHPVVLRRRRTARRAGNGFVRTVQGAWPTSLQAAIVATTGSELVVLHRRAWLQRGHRGVDSLATTVVPLGRGVRVETTSDPRWTGIRRLRLDPTGVTFLAVADDGVEDAVRALLGDR
jgi:hypothetical protein